MMVTEPSINFIERPDDFDPQSQGSAFRGKMN